MSRLYFSSPSGEAELGGAEYHWLRQLAYRPGISAWDLDDFDRAAEIMALLTPERNTRHLFDEFDKASAQEQRNKELWAEWERMPRPRPHPLTDYEPQRQFVQTLRTSMRVNSHAMTIAGVGLRTGDVELNTALAAGSDPVRLAAKLACWADRFPFVEGSDRAWMAGIIEQGLKSGMYRHTLNGHDLGWQGVVEFLRSRDDEPVVLHYSVEDSFPSRSVADWTAPQMPEDWVPEWARNEEGRAEWDAEERFDVRSSYWDEHVSDLWYALPEAERWERSLAGLREKRPWIRLYPDLAHYTFHLGVNVYDLFAPDRDERVLAAAAEVDE